jgi:hypothetical protein
VALVRNRRRAAAADIRLGASSGAGSFAGSASGAIVVSDIGMASEAMPERTPAT